MDGLIGRTLGSYRVIDEIGKGGMGRVFLAEHETIGRKAAIKVIHKKHAETPDVIQRFFNEARAANRVNHPGVVEIYDVGESDEFGPYLIMELLEGENLSERLRRVQILSPDEAVPLLQLIASALEAAHEAGIVHRDLKPGNVFVVPDPDRTSGERVKVLDFGIAKLVSDLPPGSAHTRTGAVLGTPTYMSPEQCDGAKHVTLATDIYALGVIAYKMLCGRPPFVSPGFGKLIAMHQFAPPPPLRKLNPTLPEALEKVVMKALAKEPSARQANMRELSDALAMAIGMPEAPRPSANLARTLPSAAPIHLEEGETSVTTPSNLPPGEQGASTVLEKARPDGAAAVQAWRQSLDPNTLTGSAAEAWTAPGTPRGWALPVLAVAAAGLLGVVGATGYVSGWFSPDDGAAGEGEPTDLRPVASPLEDEEVSPEPATSVPAVEAAAPATAAGEAPVSAEAGAEPVGPGSAVVTGSPEPTKAKKPKWAGKRPKPKPKPKPEPRTDAPVDLPIR